ncbi:MAG: hypothetical protein JXP34_27285 [Planctomycetes bacterium]|nr:hypothetical protein [Planctomycetota bacterium]
MPLTDKSIEEIHKLLRDRRERAKAAAKGLSKNGSGDLAEIEAAIQRLKKGEYGYCSACFLEIPMRDLFALPERRTCAQCTPRR